ncbi:MAG TPA: hypothetical protein VHJ38_00350 [Nitrososphaeraceae archaeon]|nr:hypothetical protein [Nitrososphaeraceae archaeon]
MVPLHTNDYIVSVKKVRDFMFGDLEKTLSLIDTQEGGPNFVLALALSCYTEYWGQFLIGKKIDFMVIIVNVLMNSSNDLVPNINILLDIIIIIMIILNVIIIYTVTLGVD